MEENSSASRAAVRLKRRKLVNGYIDALTPENITNSGEYDGAWMDSDGVVAAGLGKMFSQTPDPVDMFISNNAYDRAGFATLTFELYPPLEVSSGKPYEPKASNRENLMDFLETQISSRENNSYRAGAYIARDSPRIGHPKGLPKGTTNADIIVQKWYERPVDGSSPYLPANLTSKEQFAALSFSGKGIVVIKATNFERHDKSINIMDISSSVRFIGETYFGFTFGINPPDLTMGHFPRSSDGVPKLCFHCGKNEEGKSGVSNNGAKVDFKRCSRCKLAAYCSGECQKADWKRHKKGECLPRAIAGGSV
eukprot:scaffold3922_cov85-Skeletonema_dohrnii-CCMP3373.AAC.7